MQAKRKCMAPNCGNDARTNGYCPKHYRQIRRYGRLTPEREYSARPDACSVPGCGKRVIAKMLCFKHYQQVRRYGRLRPDKERTYGRTGCVVPGCTSPHLARGYCTRHYMSEYYSPRHAAKTRQVAA